MYDYVGLRRAFLVLMITGSEIILEKKSGIVTLDNYGSENAYAELESID